MKIEGEVVDISILGCWFVGFKPTGLNSEGRYQGVGTEGKRIMVRVITRLVGGTWSKVIMGCRRCWAFET